MNMENMDEMKRQWKELDVRVNRLEAGKSRTCLDRIGGMYRRMWILGLAVLVPGWNALGHTGGAPAGAQVLWCVVMLMAAGVDMYLWHGVGKIDPSAMSVKEVADRAARLRRVHLMSQLVMAPFALAFLIFLAIGADEYMRAGIITGAVIGGLAGLRISRRIMRDYRALIEAGRDSFADLEVRE